MRNIAVLSCLLVAQIASAVAGTEAASDKVAKVPAINHLTLHKWLSVGASLGQRFRVSSRLGARGHHLENPAVESDFRTRIKTSEDSLDKADRSRLYDLRGKMGCFEGALMDNGKFELFAVRGGSCD